MPVKGINEVTLVGYVSSVIDLGNGCATIKVITGETRRLENGDKIKISTVHIVHCSGSVKQALFYVTPQDLVWVRGRLDYDSNKNIKIIAYNITRLTN